VTAQSVKHCSPPFSNCLKSFVNLWCEALLNCGDSLKDYINWPTKQPLSGLEKVNFFVWYPTTVTTRTSTVFETSEDVLNDLLFDCPPQATGPDPLLHYSINIRPFNCCEVKEACFDIMQSSFIASWKFRLQRKMLYNRDKEHMVLDFARLLRKLFLKSTLSFWNVEAHCTNTMKCVCFMQRFYYSKAVPSQIHRVYTDENFIKHAASTLFVISVWINGAVWLYRG